jgi:hypothetical protein
VQLFCAYVLGLYFATTVGKKAAHRTLVKLTPGFQPPTACLCLKEFKTGQRHNKVEVIKHIDQLMEKSFLALKGIHY